MKLIDLLELLVKDSNLNRRQRADAQALIEDLRKINAFGTAVQDMNGRHICKPRYVYMPGNGFYGSRSVSKYVCEICDKDMGSNV